MPTAQLEVTLTNQRIEGLGMLHRLMRILAITALVFGCWSVAPHGTGLSIDFAFADGDDGGDDGGGDDGGGDDGGGDDGGGGGGGAGAGGDGISQWSPFGQSYSRTYRRSRPRRARPNRRRVRQRVQRRRQRPVQRARPAPRRFAAGREIVAAGLNDAQFARLEREGYRVIGRARVPGLDIDIARLILPRMRSIPAALRRIRRFAGPARAVRNSVYRRPQRDGFRPAGAPCGQSCAAFELTGWTDDLQTCTKGIRIGMIDTGVDVTHTALSSANIKPKTIVRKDRPAASLAHGTAVASLLVGRQTGPVAGVVPGIELVAINAFYRAHGGEQADTFDLVHAMGLLIDQRVAAINMSLTGPQNDLLEQAVERATASGISVVAAVGHPARGVGYPALYPGVVAVSAVDARLRSSRRNRRGSHVAFAAPGSGVTVAKPGGGIELAEGSSFATPFVTAAYAVASSGTGSNAHSVSADDVLARAARDLGPRGRDRIYGWGLIQYQPLIVRYCQ